MADGEKGLDLTHRMRNPPTTSSSGPHQTRISSQNTKSKLVRNSIKPSEGPRKDSGISRSLPGTPTKKIDPKASYRPSEVPTKNEDPKVSYRPPSPEVPSSVFPLDLSEQVPVTGDLPLEDFEALAKWAERKREELSKDPTPPFVQTNSRIMALLKELTSDTFDEDKYKLSRRIEAYFNRAYQSALTDIDKTNVAPSSVDSFDDRSTLPLYNPILPPGDPELPTTTILTSTTTRTTITGPDMANNNLGYIRPHPPPLFSHWWVSQKQTAPMKVAYPESSSSYAKGTGHRRRARCITKTKLKKPNEKMEYYCYSSPEDYDRKADTAGRTSPKPPRSPKKDFEKKRLKKPHLEAIHQRGVNIPAGNVVEKTAVISISPRVNPLVPKEKKYTVVELVHQSLSNTSDDDVTDGENDSESIRERDLSNHPHGEPDIVDRELEEAGPSSSHKLDIPQTVSTEVQTVHRNDEEPQRDYSQSNGDPNTYSDYESDDDPSVSEKQELPGFMPEVKWEEVTMYNRREEIDGEDTRRNIHEAEGLLQEYDMRERILNRLEARLAQLTLTSQEELMRVVPPELFEDENQQEESSLNSEDLNRQMTNPTSETIRALLYNFVRDRLQVLPIQESSRSEDDESSVKKPQEVSSPVSYTSSYEIDEGTPAPPLTPMHSPVRTREESVSKITTPTSSPSPPLLPPGKSGIQDQRVLTPQDSMEEIEHTQSGNAIATPSSSPPPIRSVFDVDPSVTPGVSPAISPAKGRQIHTSATPLRTPASSPRKLQPRSRADTPADSPADSPSRLKAQYPEASTPGQSPLPSDREMSVINTPPRSPSPCRTYDVIVSVPQSPSSPVSPVSPVTTRDDPVIRRPVPEEVPGTQRMEKPKVVLSPRYFDQGTQAEFRRRVDRSTMAHLDESQDLTLDGTPSIVCHTSGEPTVYSPVEPSESTFFTISEGEVVCGQGSANVSVEEGEIARTCYLNAPEDFHVVCPSHGGVRPSSSKDEGEIMKSGSEIQITENSEDFSMSEDGTTSKLDIGSEMSVIQNDTYSSGDITAVSSQSMDALRQENEILLRRLGNLGSFGLLNLISQSSSSTSESKTN
ncbi:uncharacterized protein [Palaemon carinicauda]|uniref:uncharacterized protein n=1 Tax=Palaemon carinicauda TaxID=392227 RepID=UPI0035B5A420